MNRKLLLFYCLFLCPFLQVSAQNFGTFASAIWLTNCNTSNFFNTTGEGANLIGPPANVFTNTNFGVFIQNSGTFILRGGEVKTFKNNNGNACSVRMRYSVYLASASPGTFNTIDFPFFNDCNTAINEFPSGGPCGTGDQKWQRVIADGTTNPYSPVDLTANSPGDYVLEVFYEVTGDFNASNECDDNLILNASGNNYKAFFTVRSNPTFSSTNPTTCNGSEGTITISNLNPNSAYTFSYRDDGVLVGPTIINTDSNGSYTINLLNSGSYSNFNFVINNCSTTINSPIVLTDTVVNPPTSMGNQNTCETNPITTLTAGATTSNGSIVVWFDAPVNGNIIANPILNTVGTVTYYAEAQNLISNCISSTRTPVTLTINPAPAAPSGETTQSICSVAAVVFTLSDLVVNGSNLQWYADENLTTPLPSNHPLTHNTTYYVTQTVSGCESITYLAVLVNLNSPVTPVFDFGTEITLCSNTVFPILPTTDTNGIVGEWNPSVISNVQDGTYVFTPLNNSCATSFTLSVTVNQFQTPVFNFGNSISICSGDTPPILPDEDNNGINGFWSPAVIDNTTNGTYTFIVNNSECAENIELTVIVNELIVPTFDFGNSISLCPGENAPTLPLISNNNLNGIWNPAVINNTQSGSYTFQPSDACAESFTVNVTVTPQVTPIFTLPSSVCFNSNSLILPTVSENGILGTWNPPSVNTTQNTVYQFTPQNTACANSVSVSIAVYPEISFQITDQCESNQFILGAELTNSSNVIISDFNWMTENGVTVGTNSSTFNVTEYIRSTPQTETFPITFRVTLTTMDGCSLEESISIPSIFCGIQKGISPNDDGSNDFFDLEHFEVQKLSIFNRYGVKVYSKMNYSNQWRGQSDQGEILPTATYYYVIEFKNGETKTGWIYLMQ